MKKANKIKKMNRPKNDVDGLLTFPVAPPAVKYLVEGLSQNLGTLMGPK